MSNNPPFAIGQKVVCVKTGRCEKTGKIAHAKGTFFTIRGQKKCCRIWFVNVGIVSPSLRGTECAVCGRGINDDKYWFCFAEAFAPIQTNYADATADILENFKSPNETPDKIIIPEPINQ